MKFVEQRPFADPAAARELFEIANSVEPVQDGRIHIDKINWPFLLQGGWLAPSNTAPASSSHRAREASDARERNVRETRRCRRGAICLTLVRERRLASRTCGVAL